jgi:hypothetical protein
MSVMGGKRPLGPANAMTESRLSGHRRGRDDLRRLDVLEFFDITATIGFNPSGLICSPEAT